MTPQERQLIDQLFDRLARLEGAPRDPDAVAAIADGLRQAPNASYALVQTVLVQDEALKRANAHIEELRQQLEGGSAPAGEKPGFLDSMRETLFGREPPRSSVPNFPPGTPPPQRQPVWNTGGAQASWTGATADPRAGYGDPRGAPVGGGGGGSFLGTAAAAAAGVVGGSLLMSSIRGLMGGGGHMQGFGDSTGLGGGRSPWGGDQSGGDLAREAGLNDIGADRGHGAQSASWDQAQADADQDQDQDQDDGDYDNDDAFASDDDFGGGDDSDFA